MISSIRISSPSSTPNSNLVSAMMMPRSSAYSAPNVYSSSAMSRTFSAISRPIRSTVLSNETFSSWSPIAALVDGV